MSVEGTCTNTFIISKPLLNIQCFPDVLPTLQFVISSNKDVISRTKTLEVSVENNNDMILPITFISFFWFKNWIVLVHSTYVIFLLLEKPLADCLFEHYIIDTLLLDLKIKEK